MSKLLKNPNFYLTLKIFKSYMFWFRNEWPKWQIWSSHMSPCKECQAKYESEEVHIEQAKLIYSNTTKRWLNLLIRSLWLWKYIVSEILHSNKSSCCCWCYKFLLMLLFVLMLNLETLILKILKLMRLLLKVDCDVEDHVKLWIWKKLKSAGSGVHRQALFFFLYSVYSVGLLFFDVFDDFWSSLFLTMLLNL